MNHRHSYTGSRRFGRGFVDAFCSAESAGKAQVPMPWHSVSLALSSACRMHLIPEQVRKPRRPEPPCMYGSTDYMEAETD